MKRLAVVLALICIIAGALASGAAALRFETGDCRESPTSSLWVCPRATAGSGYKAQLEGAGGCGPALPYQYRVLSGGLPPGLSLSSSGLISGTPTTPGAWRFYVELSDQDPPSADWCRPAKSEREFRIDVDQGLPPLVLETQSVPNATVGASYEVALIAKPDGSRTWTVSGGALPPGLALSASTGEIIGTPTAEGSFAFTVTVSDSLSRSARHEYHIDVRAPLVATPLGPQGAPGGLPLAEVGISLSSKLTAAGGTETYAWSLTGVPPGVSLATDGTLGGIPLVAGSFPFTAQVSDTEGRTAHLEATLTVARKLAIKRSRLRWARTGRAYRAKLGTVGGAGVVRWRFLRGKLPLGIRFAKKLGLLAGKPRAFPPRLERRTTYRFTVQAFDALGARSERTFLLVVVKPKPRHQNQRG